MRFLATLLIFILGCGLASSEAQLVIGTYNVRVRTLKDKTEDPATNRFWDIRSDAVIQTIRDGAFDILALNELDNNVSIDGKSMMQDMTAAFPKPEYDFVTALTIPYNRNSPLHAILYKTAVVELLEQGNFWHAPDSSRSLTNQWGEGNQCRMTLWAKFKVKATGEIFYLMCTHLHHTGDMAKNEGSRLNVDMMRSIAGGYPAFICGDHNCAASRKPFYDLHCAFFDDSRAAAEKNDGSDFTSNTWNDLHVRLDYIWARGAKILDYSSSKEKYGLDFYPSDHFPVRVVARLEAPVETRCRYVSPDAADGGDGSPGTPFNKLQDAIDASGCGDTIFLAKGTYIPAPTFKIERSLTLLGGYNDDFTAVEGISALTGDGTAQVLNIGKKAAVEMSDFEVSGGKTTTEPGAGIACHGPRLILDRVSVHDNRSNSTGAGVYAFGQLVARQCSFAGNVTTGNGGAVYCDDNGSTMPWAHSVSNCTFRANKAMHGAAAYIRSTLWLNAIANTFVNNQASGNGTFHITGARTASSLTFFNNTFADNTAAKGAAIFTDGLKEGDTPAAIALTNNTIVANTSTGNGAAVNIGNAVSICINNNIIAANTSTTGHSDVYCDVPAGVTASKYNVFSTASAINYAIQSSDYRADSRTQAAEWLALAFDGTVTDGKLVVEPADNGGDTPTLRLVNPLYGTYKLNNLASSRFVETTVKADTNGDRQILKAAKTSATDQRGIERDMKGHASFGAYEYNESDAIALPSACIVPDGTGKYFNMQGIEIAEPSKPGIYICRKGSISSKIIIR